MIGQPTIALRAPAGRWRTSRRLSPLAQSLYGERAFSFPFLAAMVKTHMGAPRHVLAQMVVAGVVHQHPPVQVIVEKSPESS